MSSKIDSVSSFKMPVAGSVEDYILFCNNSHLSCQQMLNPDLRIFKWDTNPYRLYAKTKSTLN